MTTACRSLATALWGALASGTYRRATPLPGTRPRKMLVAGPLAADTDERTVKRAADGIGLFLEHIRGANPARWDSGRTGGICVNAGLRALFLLFSSLIEFARRNKRNFDPENATSTEIAEEAATLASPLLEYLRSLPDEEFAERFGRKYGSGGPLEYFYELSEIIHETDPKYAPDGLEEYIKLKDDSRIHAGEETIKFIEGRVTEIIVSYFRKLHGNNYWNYMGTKDMRVQSYERQQEVAPEEQLDLEAYLDFIDKKRIIEKPEHWSSFKRYFDIPLPGDKGYAKNLKWMDRLNELRRVVAHSYKRSFKPDDLEFLEWIRSAFEERLLTADELVPVSYP